MFILDQHFLCQNREHQTRELTKTIYHLSDFNYFHFHYCLLLVGQIMTIFLDHKERRPNLSEFIIHL
jgi:hypothetical protein